MIGAVDKRATQAQVIINGEVENCLIDTGAAISMVGKRLEAVKKPCSIVVRTVGGFTLRVEGSVE